MNIRQLALLTTLGILSLNACKKNSKIGLLATEGTLKTKIYDKLFQKNFTLVKPTESLQKKFVNKTIKYVKMGNIKLAEKSIRPAIKYLLKLRNTNTNIFLNFIICFLFTFNCYFSKINSYLYRVISYFIRERILGYYFWNIVIKSIYIRHTTT